MKKKMLLGFLQYIFVMLAVVVTVLYIYAFENNKLPFMDEAYVNLKNDMGVGGEVQTEPEGEAEHVEPLMTADLFVSSLEESRATLYSGVYDGEGCSFVKLPVTALGNLGNCVLHLNMGYIEKLDLSYNVLARYSGTEGLKDVTALLEGAALAGVRDGAGRPLFYKDGGYYVCENGAFVPSEYDSVNYDKGGMYYPSYVAGNDSGYKAFSQNGLWGVKSPTGAEVVPPKYEDVYGMEEGLMVAVKSDGTVDIYDKDGRVPFEGEQSYTVPVEGEGDLSVLGCYFFKNGLTRVYDAEGESVLINKHGVEYKLPTGFSLVAYSDGVMLLKQSYTDSDGNTTTLYGYMTSSGRWISTPDYRQAKPFYEGLAVVGGAEGKMGMIDLNGELVIPMVFDTVTDCEDGVICAFEQKYGNCIIGKIEK